MKKGFLACFVIISVICICGCGEQKKYDKAVKLLEAGSYDEAIAAFEKIVDYQDAVSQIQECKYQKAASILAAKRYDEAITTFEEIKDYKDSAEKINTCKYAIASELATKKDYEAAIEKFTSIIEYSDSAKRINECKYAFASDAFEKGEYDNAITLFEEIKDYKDSDERISECEYNLEAFAETYAAYNGTWRRPGPSGCYRENVIDIDNRTLEEYEIGKNDSYRVLVFSDDLVGKDEDSLTIKEHKRIMSLTKDGKLSIEFSDDTSIAEKVSEDLIQSTYDNREKKQSSKSDESTTTPNKDNTSSYVSDEIKGALWALAKQVVNDRLKAPSTAKYPSTYGSDGVSFGTSGDLYFVSAYVDAQNSFGATLRTEFKVYAKLEGDKLVFDHIIME